MYKVLYSKTQGYHCNIFIQVRGSQLYYEKSNHGLLRIRLNNIFQEYFMA